MASLMGAVLVALASRSVTAPLSQPLFQLCARVGPATQVCAMPAAVIWVFRVSMSAVHAA